MPKVPSYYKNSFCRAEVAQLVEQGTENPRVGSSILSLGTIFVSKEDHSGPEYLKKQVFRAFSYVS